ncbi:unnamed protein product [Diatraea saccharalis]|uniref:FP protein C-terminal domain-containing protein n=1 Tax=Diatraea saccharalis TaxID=40085 RepID=A0A9N9R6H9_9NEOP|nr:unnamed protein product [Diatraea saccharalis]
MPNLAHSPKLNKSHSMSDTDIDKLTNQDSSLVEVLHVTQRDNKRRRINERQISPECSDFRTIIREELREMLNTLQHQQNSRLDILEKYITEIKAQNESTLQKNLDIEKSIEFVTDKVNNLQLSINALEDERKGLTSQISKIDDKCDMLERLSRKTSIQIRNVPNQKAETKEALFGMISRLANSLDIKLQVTDLRDIHRMPMKPGQASSTVVAEFSSTLHKSKFIIAAKSHKVTAIKYKTEQLNSAHLGIEGPKSEIYISEHLTAQSSRLFFLARELRKSMGYDYCWTANGLVYLRKKHGEPYILVKNESQLQSLRKK